VQTTLSLTMDEKGVCQSCRQLAPSESAELNIQFGG
jgi:hypothetical protein